MSGKRIKEIVNPEITFVKVCFKVNGIIPAK
jgi:hypothetical protein